MTAKEYLNQAYKIDRRINIIRAKAEKMRAVAEYKSPSTDGTGNSGSGSDKLLNAVEKMIEYENKADELIDKLVGKRLEIENAIQGVCDPVQREILERRYLLYQPWESYLDERTGKMVKGIAESMGYSRRRIFQLHGLALKNIQVPKDCT